MNNEDDIIDIQICPEEDCLEEELMPTAKELAKNLLRDGAAVLSNALQGKQTLASDEVREARWNTCLGCPFLQKDRCLKCGCYMKVKVAFHTSKCPLDKW